MARIYISSTYSDLKDYREHVSLVLRRMGHEDVAMEYYIAEDQRPVDRCLADVAGSDVYLGIFAWRYGWIPPKDNPEKLSITEMEYRHARDSKPCLIFLLSEDAPWPRKLMDNPADRIEDLRRLLAERHGTGPRFCTVDELGRMVAEAVHAWEKRSTVKHTADSEQRVRRDEAFKALWKQAAQAADADLRIDALTQAVDTYPNAPETLSLLLRRAVWDEDKMVRMRALGLLAEFYPTEEETRAQLKRSSVNDPTSLVRSAALEHFIEVFCDEPETFAFLQQRVIQDEDMSSRCHALLLFMEEYSHHPEALALVQRVAEEDKESIVREEALAYLVEHFPRDSGVFQFLRRRAMDDPHSFVRLDILKHVVAHYSGQEVITLLMVVADRDSDPVIRLEAIEQLAKLFPERPDLLKFLHVRLKEEIPWARKEIEKVLAGLKGGNR